MSRGPFISIIFSILLLVSGCQAVKTRSQASESEAVLEKTVEPIDLDADKIAGEEFDVKLVKGKATSTKPKVAQNKLSQAVASTDAPHAKDILADESTTPETSTDESVSSEDLFAARKAGPISAEKALAWLKNGSRRFAKGSFRSDGASKKDRARLVQAQKPHATVFSCSDSRVPPEIVFDQKLGEIYVVRVSGRVVNANTLSSIEYAVQFLGTNLVVLLGHKNCNAADESTLADLMKQSKILRDGVAKGEVKVASAFYHLDSGNIDWK